MMTTRPLDEPSTAQPAVDSQPLGQDTAGAAIGPGATPGEGDPSTAEGNSYSPDFEPKPSEEKVYNPKDADIDTDGG
jgi:hypothetical protein